jgi:hypothetical protein
MGNSTVCTIHCNHRLAATLNILETRSVSARPAYAIVNLQYKRRRRRSSSSSSSSGGGGGDEVAVVTQDLLALKSTLSLLFGELC